MKIFVEGGGDKPATTVPFKRGLRSLVGKVAERMPRIVACGSRKNALDKFSHALIQGEAALLLVDSEAPVAPQNFGRPWTHLAESDRWPRPESAGDDHAHLMAQCMEAWLVADPAALMAHFGRGFNAARLPQNPEVEEVAKSDILSGLASAARETRNGGYDKVRDGFALIGIIDPVRVAKRARHAGRFFGVLRQESGARKGKE